MSLQPGLCYRFFIQKIASGPGLPGEEERYSEKNAFLCSRRSVPLGSFSWAKAAARSDGREEKKKMISCFSFPYATRPHGRLPKTPSPNH
jgi:hypothetical protein